VTRTGGPNHHTLLDDVSFNFAVDFDSLPVNLPQLISHASRMSKISEKSMFEIFLRSKIESYGHGMMRLSYEQSDWQQTFDKITSECIKDILEMENKFSRQLIESNRLNLGKDSPSGKRRILDPMSSEDESGDFVVSETDSNHFEESGAESGDDETVQEDPILDWSKEEDILLVDHLNSGFTIKEIAKFSGNDDIFPGRSRQEIKDHLKNAINEGLIIEIDDGIYRLITDDRSFKRKRKEEESDEDESRGENWGERERSILILLIKKRMLDKETLIENFPDRKFSEIKQRNTTPPQ
jgi:hypothetical protein